ncbi:MAG: c-type cytochrome [Gammaproteobacteria bacterium]
MNSRKLLSRGLILGALVTSVVMAQQSTPQASAGTAADKPTRTAAASAAGGAPYTVQDGNKVDNQTLMGWRTWRALACERCHGANQEGLVGPPLVESLKKLSKDDFHKTVMNGRPEKGMPPFSASKMVTDNWEGLYAYLKGRSDGKIKPGHVYPIDSKK